MRVPAFNQFTLANAQGFLRQAPVDLYAKDSLSFYRGDHWQCGRGWVGPWPDPLTTPAADLSGYQDKIRRAFTSANVVAEVVDRHVMAVWSEEPQWTVGVLRPLKDDEKPTTEEQALIDEAEAAMEDWIMDRGAFKIAKEATAVAKCTGMGMLRLFIPPGLLIDQQLSDQAGEPRSVKALPDGLTSAEALRFLHIEAADLDTAAVVKNPDTQREACLKLYQNGDGKQIAELVYVDYDAKGNPTQTVVRQLAYDKKATVEFRYELGGRSLMYPVRSKVMVTEQIRQQQRQLNFAETAMGKNNEMAGFMERLILNAQPPGKYVDDPTAPNGKRFIPEPFRTGPGTTPFIQGIVTGDPESESGQKIATPSVVYRDPVDPDTFIKSASFYRASILQESKQSHLLKEGDGSASGAARVHMRADYRISLYETKPDVEMCASWLLNTLLALMGLLSGDPNKFAGLRATPQIVPDAGPLTDQERTVILQRYETGTLSRESTMTLLGTDDPDAEVAKMNAELKSRTFNVDDIVNLGLVIEDDQAKDIYERSPIIPPNPVALAAKRAAEAQNRAALVGGLRNANNPIEDPTVPPIGGIGA